MMSDRPFRSGMLVFTNLTRLDLIGHYEILGCGRRVTIALHAADDSVTIDRVLYGGRDSTTALVPRS